MVFKVHSRHIEFPLVYWRSQSLLIVNFEGRDAKINIDIFSVIYISLILYKEYLNVATFNTP